jgi:hypothetical protein
VKKFLTLEKFDPNSVAQALYSMMIAQATENQPPSMPQVTNLDTSTFSTSQDNDDLANEDYNNDCEVTVPTLSEDDHITPITRNQKECSNRDSRPLHFNLQDPVFLSPWFTELQHIIYFCYLCSIEKMNHIS